MDKDTYKFCGTWNALKKKERPYIENPSCINSITEQQQQFLDTVESSIKEHERDHWLLPKIRNTTTSHH